MEIRFNRQSPTHNGTVCRSCGHYNPPGLEECGNCGRHFDKKKTSRDRAPGELSLGQGILIFVGGIAGIAAMIGFFLLYVHVYWLGSVLLTGLLIYLIKPWRTFKTNYGSGVVFLFFAFMALMGMSLDQGGNWLYNRPYQLIFCESDEMLTQELHSYSYKPGETTYTRSFYCEKANGAFRELPLFPMLGVRFAWYLVLCYLLYGIKALWPRGEGMRFQE